MFGAYARSALTSTEADAETMTGAVDHGARLARNERGDSLGSMSLTCVLFDHGLQLEVAGGRSIPLVLSHVGSVEC